jgi:predicted TIM-barrel fold metal-dependent hydrolase
MSDASDRHQVVISTDGHCGAHLRGYKPYLEQRYQDLFDDWADNFHDAWSEDLDQDRDIDNRAGVASSVSTLNWDSDRRTAHLDSQGIAAEVLFPNTAPPFYPSGVLTSPGPRSREEYELRMAGLRAHNRWLADFCSESPERRAGFAQVFLDDVDEAIAEVRWAAEHGLRGVLVPGDHVQKMAGLYYPALDPLWAACAEVGLPVHRHAAAPTESLQEGGNASQLVHFMEIQFYSGRAISHMVLSGVFERYPDLKFVTTEISSASEVKTIIDRMDMIVRLRDMGTGTPFYEHVKDGLAELKRMPSEYVASNCYIGGPHDVRAAHELGVPNVMWGSDTPHSEGSDPYTREALRVEFWDMPADERSLLICDRAAELYGFDMAVLQGIADRVGPTIAELDTPVSAEEWPRYPEQTCHTVFRGGPKPAVPAA